MRKRRRNLPRPTPFRPLGGWDRASCGPEQAASVLSLIRVEGTEMLGASSSGPRDDGGVTFLWVGLVTTAWSSMASLTVILSDGFLVLLFACSSEVPNVWTNG